MSGMAGKSFFRQHIRQPFVNQKGIHPITTMSLFESGESTGEISLRDLFDGKKDMFGESKLTIERIAIILTRGGWPEAVVEENEKYALLRSISRNISATANTQTLLRDLASNDKGLSYKTISSYISAMKKLYVIEDLPAWSPHLRSKHAIRTTGKRHFTAPSIAAAALRADSRRLLSDFKTFGYLFESLCIRDLQIYADSLDGSVYHYRDQLNFKVDAIIQLKDERWAAVEIKNGSGRD
ncbi:MAG: DUF4143 domain-containing protein [Clostridiaceae bacterium]|nr:DUF4143 domain-containing protein [Clostridiaceae bacterium]